MRAQSAGTAACALDVDIIWGDGTTIHSEHVSPAREYVLSQTPIAKDSSGFIVSREWIGADSHRLVSVHGDRVLLHTADGDVPLKLGGPKVPVTFGPLTFHVSLSEPTQPAVGLRSGSPDLRQHAWTLLSCALHGLALLCMAMMPPRAQSMSLDWLSEDTRTMRYLSTPVESHEALPWTAQPSAAPGSSASAAQAARGDEGQAGRSDARRTERRAERPARRELQKSSSAAATSAENAGILGVLGALAALDSAPDFARYAPNGYDAQLAMGNAYSTQPGDGFGFHGLGMRGTGRHGGGDVVAGSVAVGRLGTIGAHPGDGSANGRGPSHGLASSRHTERVPGLIVGEADVHGSLSKEVIRREIHRHLSEVRFCYEQALRSRPELAGRVAIRFVVSASGAVQSAEPASSTLGSPPAEACIVSAVRRWTFPAPEGGGYVIVSYPFVFEPVGQ